jgi:hypothetical protein
MHPDHRHALDAWLATHRGVVSTQGLTACKLTKDELRGLIGRGQLVPVFPGVYRSPAHPVTERQTLVAICLAVPSAAISHTTAGRHWEWRGMADGTIHVLVPHGCSPKLPGVIVHRTRKLDATDVSMRDADGVRYTSPPRTAFDVGDQLNATQVESVIEQVLLEKTCTLETLVRTATRLFHPRRPGATMFRDVLMSRPKWRNATRSELERGFRDAIEARGLPLPEISGKTMLSDGVTYEFDLVWKPWSVFGEVDHPFWHDRSVDIQRDKRRDRKAAGDGWLTVRFTEVDVTVGLEESLDDLTKILLQRGWAPD